MGHSGCRLPSKALWWRSVQERRGHYYELRGIHQEDLPITIQKGRDPKKELNQAEKSKYRGRQGMPALVASTSLIAGNLAKGIETTMAELNKTLCFGKEAAKHPLLY